MAEEQDVRINAWPKEQALLAHSFDQSQAHVVVATEKPFDVGMAMQVSAREAIPLCIKVCDPICVSSEYVIGIEIFDRPFASITVRGQTKIFTCDEER
jgi:hypothetical protein